MNPNYLDQVYDDIAAVYGSSFNSNRADVTKALLEDKNYVQHIWSELSKNQKSTLVRNEKDINSFFTKIQNTKLKDVAPAYTAKEESNAKVIEDAEKKEESIIENGILDGNLKLVSADTYSPYDNDETPAATQLRQTVANYANPNYTPTDAVPGLYNWLLGPSDEELAARRKQYDETTVREDYNARIQIERERQKAEEDKRRQKAQLSKLAKYELNLGISGDLKFFENADNLGKSPVEKKNSSPGEWKTKDKYLYENDAAYRAQWDGAGEFNLGDESLSMLQFIDNSMSLGTGVKTNLVEKAKNLAWGRYSTADSGFDPSSCLEMGCGIKRGNCRNFKRVL